MIRNFDFECSVHGVFESMITTETVPDYMECRCGEPARRVWRSAPGMQPKDSVHAVEFGGRTFRRDELEAFMDRKPAEPSAAEQEAKRERLRDVFSRAAYQEMHGTLPPQPEASPEALTEVASSLAGVSIDPEKVKAHSNQLTDAMRTMDFKE